MFDRAAGIALLLAVVAAPAFADPVPRDRVEAALPQLEAMARKSSRRAACPGSPSPSCMTTRWSYLEGLRPARGRQAGDGRPPTPSSRSPRCRSRSPRPSWRRWSATGSWPGIRGSPTSTRPSRSPTLIRPRELTVRDLFNHRSGLPGTAGDDLEAIGYDRAEILHRLRFVPPSSSFRAGYSYSNFGLTEGALAAAKPTGKAWEDVAEEKLYRPLGMTSTSSRHADFLKRANRAALHIPVGGAWAPKVKRDPDAQAPAGGVSSTARDLAQWVRLELGDGSYDGKPLIAPMRSTQTHVPLMARGSNPVSGGASFYGLGWNVEFGRHGLSWGHAGAFSVGARTLVTLLPGGEARHRRARQRLPDRRAGGAGRQLSRPRLRRRAAKDWSRHGTALCRPVRPGSPRPRRPMPRRRCRRRRPAAAAYVGRYANDYVGDARVGAGPGGALVLSSARRGQDPTR